MDLHQENGHSYTVGQQNTIWTDGSGWRMGRPGGYGLVEERKGRPRDGQDFGVYPGQEAPPRQDSQLPSSRHAAS